MGPKVFDIVIVGNGAIGSFIAERLGASGGGARIALIGPRSHPFSATLAAGAMHAVFGEVEETFDTSEKEQRAFALGLRSRPLWNAWFAETGAEAVVTTGSTVLFAKKEGTPFEVGNFSRARSMAMAHGCGEDLSQAEKSWIFKGTETPPESLDALRVTGEFGFNPPALFDVIARRLEAFGVQEIDARAVSLLEGEGGRTRVTVEGGTPVEADRVIVCAGSETSALVKELFKVVPTLKGVGSALVLRDGRAEGFGISEVIRSPNRGGAQCGVHCVPYGDGRVYVGAGNYLSVEPGPTHRAETIRYLTDRSEKEILGRSAIYYAQMDLVAGYRPRSLDGFPVIGSPAAHPGVFIASGCNRIGLSWSPVIWEAVDSWLNDAPFDLFNGWNPDRPLKNWGDLDAACEYYARSRTANLVEHALLDPTDEAAFAAKSSELHAYAEETTRQLQARFGWASDFQPDPDLFEIFKGLAAA